MTIENRRRRWASVVPWGLCALALGCNQGGSAGTDAPATSSRTTVTTQTTTSDRAVPPANSSDLRNTGINVRDRNESAKVPTDQGENQKDIDITADIRKRVVNANMSTEATNVKIITENGRVTLRGLVATKDEKEDHFANSDGRGGSGECVNQLEISNK